VCIECVPAFMAPCGGDVCKNAGTTTCTGNCVGVTNKPDGTVCPTGACLNGVCTCVPTAVWTNLGGCSAACGPGLTPQRCDATCGATCSGGYVNGDEVNNGPPCNLGSCVTIFPNVATQRSCNQICTANSLSCLSIGTDAATAQNNCVEEIYDTREILVATLCTYPYESYEPLIGTPCSAVIVSSNQYASCTGGTLGCDAVECSNQAILPGWRTTGGWINPNCCGVSDGTGSCSEYYYMKTYCRCG
jgi:hypothetical protein